MLRRTRGLSSTLSKHWGRFFMSKTSLKNIQKQKKKARRTIDRPAQTRVQGNTAAVRKRLKKLSGLARAKKATAA